MSTLAIDWSRPETWPREAREQSAGRRTAFEVASLLEMGLASVEESSVEIPYSNFPEIEAEEFRLTTAFATPSPFLLKIDRSSDIGRPDFRYRYQYVLGAVTGSAATIRLLREAGCHRRGLPAGRENVFAAGGDGCLQRTRPGREGAATKLAGFCEHQALVARGQCGP